MKSSGAIRIFAAFGLAAMTSVAFADSGPTDGGPRTSHRPHHAAPRHDRPSDDHAAHGKASFYAPSLRGRKTASGEPYDPTALTAAHRTLPLGTKVKVVNPKNDRSVVVTINDRGPVPKGRMLDVSSAAADALGMKKSGVARVETEIVGKPDAKPETGRDGGER